MIPLEAKHEARRNTYWMNAARAHDPTLHLHSVHVSELCARFSAFLNLPVDQQTALKRAGLLHDIGKLKIPVAILQKPSPLTPEETTIVQAHAYLGYEMLLENGETDELLLNTTRDHHERLDGSGYPRQLTAPDISIAVRIMTLCDVFAAMTEPRPYVAAMKWDEALATMAKMRNRLDHDLLAGFATMMTALHAPKKRFGPLGNRLRKKKT